MTIFSPTLTDPKDTMFGTDRNTASPISYSGVSEGAIASGVSTIAEGIGGILKQRQRNEIYEAKQAEAAAKQAEAEREKWVEGHVGQFEMEQLDLEAAYLDPSPRFIAGVLPEFQEQVRRLNNLDLSYTEFKLRSEVLRRKYAENLKPSEQRILNFVQSNITGENTSGAFIDAQKAEEDRRQKKAEENAKLAEKLEAERRAQVVQNGVPLDTYLKDRKGALEYVERNMAAIREADESRRKLEMRKDKLANAEIDASSQIYKVVDGSLSKLNIELNKLIQDTFNKGNMQLVTDADIQSIGVDKANNFETMFKQTVSGYKQEVRHYGSKYAVPVNEINLALTQIDDYEARVLNRLGLKSTSESVAEYNNLQMQLRMKDIAGTPEGVIAITSMKYGLPIPLDVSAKLLGTIYSANSGDVGTATKLPNLSNDPTSEEKARVTKQEQDLQKYFKMASQTNIPSDSGLHVEGMVRTLAVSANRNYRDLSERQQRLIIKMSADGSLPDILNKAGDIEALNDLENVANQYLNSVLQASSHALAGAIEYQVSPVVGTRPFTPKLGNNGQFIDLKFDGKQIIASPKRNAGPSEKAALYNMKPYIDRFNEVITAKANLEGKSNQEVFNTLAEENPQLPGFGDLFSKQLGDKPNG